ncbi:hypothetical protein LX15_002943 [Streptoalloteichus tenebrarius]|uniref:VWFD domain-containing protein n=2 Tax=Streptoalloteichus tenebrarius (strain ATCC 17920 / DSM 40477 / JCM 4838 / CBS 697.72 / NBRC 16177 / NCIMB 11028 / NRRL B-12390 / A12253. 1 / ISP 5477) TaxID=1933 RepID=A0ABT1HUQ4_STRSD|nr:hypothetical protein [Streptoalloteichus tenebrarius]BFE99000.1 hypothetical protein GCM10020241_06760 [Streptoalloteichus tenebrarius]
MSLAAPRRGAVRGLLGNFNGRPEDDLDIPGSGPLAQPPAFEPLHRAFADAWRVTATSSLFTYEPGTSTETFTDRALPEREVRAEDLPNRASAEALCRRLGITDEVTLDACTLDVGLTGEARFALADAAPRGPW